MIWIGGLTNSRGAKPSLRVRSRLSATKPKRYCKKNLMFNTSTVLWQSAVTSTGSFTTWKSFLKSVASLLIPLTYSWVTLWTEEVIRSRPSCFWLLSKSDTQRESSWLEATTKVVKSPRFMGSTMSASVNLDQSTSGDTALLFSITYLLVQVLMIKYFVSMADFRPQSRLLMRSGLSTGK